MDAACVNSSSPGKALGTISTKRFGTLRFRPLCVGGSVNSGGSGASGGGDGAGEDSAGGDSAGGDGEGMCEGPAMGTCGSVRTLRLPGPDYRVIVSYHNVSQSTDEHFGVRYTPWCSSETAIWYKHSPGH